jgi:hypothetical protein
MRTIVFYDGYICCCDQPSTNIGLFVIKTATKKNKGLKAYILSLIPATSK